MAFVNENTILRLILDYFIRLKHDESAKELQKRGYTMDPHQKDSLRLEDIIAAGLKRMVTEEEEIEQERPFKRHNVLDGVNCDEEQRETQKRVKLSRMAEDKTEGAVTGGNGPGRPECVEDSASDLDSSSQDKLFSKLRSKILERQMKVFERQSTVVELQSTVVERQSIVVERQSKIVEMQDSHKAMKEDIAALLMRFRLAEDRLERDITDLKKDNDHLKREITDLKTDNDRIKRDNDRIKRDITDLKKDNECKHVVIMLKDFDDIQKISKKINNSLNGFRSLNITERLILKNMRVKCRIGGGISGLLACQNRYCHHAVSMASIAQCRELVANNNIFQHFHVKGRKAEIMKFVLSTEHALKTVRNFMLHNPHIGMSVHVKSGRGQVGWKGKYRSEGRYGGGGGSVEGL